MNTPFWLQALLKEAVEVMFWEDSIDLEVPADRFVFTPFIEGLDTVMISVDFDQNTFCLNGRFADDESALKLDTLDVPIGSYTEFIEVFNQFMNDVKTEMQEVD